MRAGAASSAIADSAILVQIGTMSGGPALDGVSAIEQATINPAATQNKHKMESQRRPCIGELAGETMSTSGTACNHHACVDRSEQRARER